MTTENERTFFLPARPVFRKQLRPHSCSCTRVPAASPVVVEVDAASSLAPINHLLREGDFSPVNTDAALKQETKP